MRFQLVVPIAVFLLVAVFGCKKEDPKTSQEMLEGKWNIYSTEILGNIAYGDGSYLQFNACSSTCGGVDYDAGDTTTGTFTYTINEEATILNISDTSSNGGNWNAAWDILDFTDTKLRITATTVLGNLTCEFHK